MESFLPFHMGGVTSDVPDEGVYEGFEKKYFHNLIDTAFIWLSKLSQKEKPLIVPIRKSDPLGKVPGGTFRCEAQCRRLKSSCQSRMVRKDGLEKIRETVVVTAECNAKEFLWNHTHSKQASSQGQRFPFDTGSCFSQQWLKWKTNRNHFGRKEGSSQVPNERKTLSLFVTRCKYQRFRARLGIFIMLINVNEPPLLSDLLLIYPNTRLPLSNERGKNKTK